MCAASITHKDKPWSMRPCDAAAEEKGINAKPNYAMMPDDCNACCGVSGEVEASGQTFHTAIQDDSFEDLEEELSEAASDSGLQETIQMPSFRHPVRLSFPHSDATFWGLNNRDVGLRQTFALDFVDTSKMRLAPLVQSLLAEPMAPDPSAPLPVHEPLPWRGVGACEA
mmetsp:Transcript_41040/g.118587  ORF Transcript_41040/g.118587 Transcript_41040/m.118587 type:complete len:169 (+) Transcript_41040:79-585(+)